MDRDVTNTPQEWNEPNDDHWIEYEKLSNDTKIQLLSELNTSNALKSSFDYQNFRLPQHIANEHRYDERVFLPVVKFSPKNVKNVKKAQKRVKHKQLVRLTRKPFPSSSQSDLLLSPNPNSLDLLLEQGVIAVFPSAGKLPPPLPHVLHDYLGYYYSELKLSNWLIDDEIFDVDISMDEPVTLKDFKNTDKKNDFLPDSLFNLFGDVNIEGDLEIELDEKPKKLKGSRKFRR